MWVRGWQCGRVARAAARGAHPSLVQQEAVPARHHGPGLEPSTLRSGELVCHSLSTSLSLSLSVTTSLCSLSTHLIFTANYIKYCIDCRPQHRLVPPRLTPFISPLSTHLSFTFHPYYISITVQDVSSNTLQFYRQFSTYLTNLQTFYIHVLILIIIVYSYTGFNYTDSYNVRTICYEQSFKWTKT